MHGRPHASIGMSMVCVRDTSQYAFSPALGYASGIMALCTFLFCMIVAFIFWVATMGDKAKAPAVSSKGRVAARLAGDGRRVECAR